MSSEFSKIFNIPKGKKVEIPSSFTKFSIIMERIINNHFKFFHWLKKFDQNLIFFSSEGQEYYPEIEFCLLTIDIFLDFYFVKKKKKKIKDGFISSLMKICYKIFDNIKNKIYTRLYCKFINN